MAEGKKNSGAAINARIWYTLSNFVVKIASFITMPIFERLFSASEIGTFSNILSWYSFYVFIV